MHVCAAPHFGPVPQRHSPADEQLFAFAGSHGPHAWPLAAQAANARGVHTLPAQQPVVHEVESHTQLPFAQRWPAPHAAPVPHAQLPDAEQLSAVIVEQLWQLPPLGPQVETVGAVHWLPLQQPLGHEAILQTQPPRPHTWPGPHSASVPQRQAPVAEQAFALLTSQALHIAPGAPHEVPEVGFTQTLPMQQPPGHDVWSHTHVVFTQRRPLPHAPVAPHWQAPMLEQRSAFAVSQPTHAFPAAAHEPSVRELHAAPLQQPLGHDVASHSQLPATQRWPVAHSGMQTLVPPPPPAPPPVPPSSPQLARQNPSQHAPRSPAQSFAVRQAVKPSAEGSEQLHDDNQSAPQARASRVRGRMVTPTGRGRSRSRATPPR